MAVYKVPQDVEADDKLIGPFSFRQFIYLIIVAIAIFIGYLLSKIFIGLIIIVLPIIVLFGAIALPLRKDQPMETYLVAVVRFFLKPRIRMWSPEGSLTMVSITTPVVAEQHLTKDFGGDEAAERLSYLAQVVDTQGWATRGVVDTPNNSMSDVVVAEAQAQTDLFDDHSSIAQSFDHMINQNDARRKQQLMKEMQQATATPSSAQTGNDSIFPLSASPDPSVKPNYDPYPAAMHQRVIKPADTDSSQPTPRPAAPIAPAPQQRPQQQIPPRPIVATPSPDTIRLANTKDLSISALANEAHRLASKDAMEVDVPLR